MKETRMKFIISFLVAIILLPSTVFAVSHEIRLENQATLVKHHEYKPFPKLYYSIETSYPQIKAVSLTVSDKNFNKLVTTLINNTSSEFIKKINDEGGMAQYKKDPLSDMAPLGVDSNNLVITYDVINTQNGIISIRFTVSTYYYGSAHQNAYSVSMNYDVSNQKELALSDLFIPNSSYLKIIAAYCQKQLISSLELTDKSSTDWVKEGAGATAENYNTWNMTSKGLLISFDTYQVASYMDGMQQVLIPYKIIDKILKKQWV